MNWLSNLLLPALVGLGGFYVLRKHWSAQPKPAKPSSSAPVGVNVAKAVANSLEQGAVLAYTHRDYCGVGLRYADGEYIYGEVTDGDLPSTKQLQSWPSIPQQMERQTFGSRDAFVSWLSEQSDQSLSGERLHPEWLVGNQRLTLSRLIAFVNDNSVPFTK